jgi:S-adenosylmethionine:tRNA ribosyltransferase-isomerase
MHISDFNYSLPENLIAQHPPKIRGESRLLVLDRDTGAIEHKKYKDLIEFVSPGDTIILNDTKVIKARLNGVSSNGKNREFLLLERHNTHLDTHHWKVLYKGKVRTGEAYQIGDSTVTVEKVHSGGIAEISSKQDLLDISDKYGTVPLPPYMKRDASQEDIDRYQTEFAREAGSVAAPTASLNFTNELKDKLKQKGVHVAYLTLHVGIGTFLPIRTDHIEDHIMHSEYFEIPLETVQAIRQAKHNNKKILAVGTTVTRTLECAHKQLLEGPEQPLSGEADIFIYPGYQFKVIDMLLTNFHAPKTTVLMLTSALAGWQNLKQAYDTAVQQKYNFLSYGDSMLII